jgi:hypothetical protein
MILQEYDDDALVTTTQVAALFGVKPKTVIEWAKAGELASIRRSSGQGRFRVADVRALLVRSRSADFGTARLVRWRRLELRGSRRRVPAGPRSGVSAEAAGCAPREETSADPIRLHV